MKVDTLPVYVKIMPTDKATVQKSVEVDSFDGDIISLMCMIEEVVEDGDVEVVTLLGDVIATRTNSVWEF